MRLFAFWPILVLISIPQTAIVYWEHDAPEYPDRAACEAVLPRVEAEALADDGFKGFVMGVNAGVLPELRFSRECTEKPPLEFLEDLRRAPGQGDST